MHSNSNLRERKLFAVIKFYKQGQAKITKVARYQDQVSFGIFYQQKDVSRVILNMTFNSMKKSNQR